MKSIPLSKAKYYVAELTKAYLKLRKPQETFECFESRVLRIYSKGAIEFILRWNVDVCEPNSFEKLSFDQKWQPNVEHNEIFLLGLTIYKQLTKKNAYQGTHLFNPIEITPPKHPSEINSTIDRKLGDIIMKMIAPSSKRYEVFTEIIKEL